MADVFSSSVSGLLSAQSVLATIAHNVANANTPGYARQTVTMGTQASVKTGAGFIGSGVILTGVTAQVSGFLESQLASAASHASASNQLNGLYTALQSSIASSTNGLGASLANFSAALTQAAANPQSVPARQLALATAGDLSARFISISGQLSEQRANVNKSIEQAASSANTLVAQIASLNDNITSVEPRDANGQVAPGSMANDLRAQRAELIKQLSTFVSVSQVETTTGVNVYANGVSLVVGKQGATIASAPDPLDPTRVGLAIKSSAGSVPVDTESMGGKIGALAQFVSKGLDQARAQLDQIASVYAKTVNDQLAKGLDLNGSPGAPMFGTAQPTIAEGGRNSGSLSPSVTVDASITPGSDYKLSYGSSGYMLTRSFDGALVASGATLPITADGLTLSAPPGTPASGDSWLIRPYGDAAARMSMRLADPKQLAFASPVATAANPNNSSTATIAPAAVTSGLPLDANLTQPVSITFTSATAYTISGPGIGTLTNQPYTAGADISHNGWTTNINGAPKAGDSFTVGPSGSAPGDSANINALSKALGQKAFKGGTESIADMISNIQSQVGTLASVAQTQDTSAQSLLKIAVSNRESYSGVNLDEEAASLAKWQQIYSANAQVMSVAQQLFSNLISSISN